MKTTFAVGACAAAATAAAAAPGAGFVGVDGARFTLEGCTFRFTGTNSYFQMIHRHRADHPGVNEVLDEMAARGMTVLRTWAFQDLVERPDCLQCAPAGQLPAGAAPADYLSETAFVGLDECLAAADQRGIRVILTLVNNWDDFGGMKRYTLWRFGTPGHDEFYTDPVIVGWFKEYIHAMVHRVNTVNGRMYRDDPAILAWELANEPRTLGGGTHADLDAWIADVSGYIRSLDANHLVTTGIEGFYGPAHAERNTDSWMTSGGTDFIANHAHASIDFATLHVWPQNWGWDPVGSTASALEKAADYVAVRLEDAGSLIGKPAVLEEFGLPRDNFGIGVGSGPTTIRDAFYAGVFYAAFEQSAAAEGPGGGTLNWHLLDTPSAAYDDGNGAFLPEDAATDMVMTAHAAAFATPDADGDGIPDACDPGCPWDCGGVPDGVVAILDFLVLLQQWGQPGASCDVDGAGVNVTDFLALLQHWGPCP